jgi:hypothetical protein
MGHRRIPREERTHPRAEGDHGPITHRRFVEQLHSREPKREPEQANEGKHRLVEDRQQHDGAESNSEKTR